MNLSKYNLYFSEDEILKIVNTKTGAIVNITDENILYKLNLLKDGKEIQYDKHFSLLKTLGMVVEEGIEENCDDPAESTLIITIFVTKQCNFRCTYCYEKFNNKKFSSEDYKKVLSFIETQVISKELKKVRLNLFGGEPLIVYEDLIDFLNKVRKNLSELGVELSVGMTSNGYLLSIDRYKNLVELGLDDVQITVDGFSDTHNKMRHLISGEKTWNVIMKNLDDISQYPKHSKIILRTNFNTEIIEKEKEFLMYCKKRFNNQFIMHFEAIKKFDENYKEECIQNNEEQEIVVDLIKFCKNNDINHIYKNVLSRGFYACPQCSINSFVFDEYLQCKKCTVLLDLDKNHVGQLEENGVLKINKNINEWNMQHKKCKECNLYPVCLGRKCLGSKIKEGIDFCDYNYIHENIKKIIYAAF